MAKITDSILNQLQKMYNLGFKKSPNKAQKSEVYPLKTEKDKKGDTHLRRENFEPEVQRLFNWYMENTHAYAQDWKNREHLYEDMDILYNNCALISRSIELIADETLQADSNEQMIFVDAKAKVRKFILDFFDEINLYDYLRPAVVDIAQYGNSCWLLGFDDQGINEIIPIDIYSLKDRLEFTPYQVKKKMTNNDALLNSLRGLDRVQQLIDSALEKESSTTYFKHYLFGFQIEDYVVPPWKCIHFRNLTNKSPFAPFGIPMYIHAMSAYRQMDAAMTLQQAARAASFPKDLWKIDLPNVVDPTTKFQKATEFLNEFNNVGLGNSKKQMPGIGDTIVTVKDLVDYEQITPNIDLGKIDDLEMLRDDIIVATMLPRYIIDPKDSGFGDSGIAMVEKWKPFARLIFRVQKIVLQNITQLVKLHMVYSQKFSLDEIDFTLSMKFPESQTSGDIISSQSSLLDLANNIIGAIQDKITGGEQLPADLVKDIYTQFLPYDTAKIEKWVDDSAKAFEKGETIPVDDGSDDGYTGYEDEEEDLDQDSMVGPVPPNTKNIKASDPNKVLLYEKIKADNMWRMLEKEIGKAHLRESVNDIIREEKQKVLREGVLNSRHYYSSKIKNVDFDPVSFRELDKNRIKKLEEKEDVSEYAKEEVEYKFTYDHEDKKKKRLKETNKRGRK